MMYNLTSIPQNVSGQQVNPTTIIQGMQIHNFTDMLKGLNELQAHCSSIYPNVAEPFCVRNNQPFILRPGSDPLDLINIYKNEGRSDDKVPSHWHYVGFGLSDIYNYSMLCGYDRIMRQNDNNYANSVPPLPELYPPKITFDQSELSGFGFELTFRIQCEDSDQQPPMWPVRIMQDLAGYVFRSMNVFKVGDHVAWRCSLDEEGESRIKHMLMTLDPQLNDVKTSTGRVKFIQIVGVCQDELQAARDYNVAGVLEIMAERVETGGQFLVTNMRRCLNIFELDPLNRKKIDAGISKYGSDMTLISAKHKYSAIKPWWFKEVESSSNLHNDESDEQEQLPLLPDSMAHHKHSIQGVERGSLLTKSSYNTNSAKSQDNHFDESRVPSRMSMESESELKIENAELLEVRAYDNLYLLLNFESAKVLPVALRGRLAHKKAFTYQSFNGELVTTLVPEGYGSECLVSREQPFARKGTWLQIYVPDELRQLMLKSIEGISCQDSVMDSWKDRNFSWPEYRLHITIVDEMREAMDIA